MTTPAQSVREVTTGAALPALGSVPGVARVETDVRRFGDEYLDTPDATLLRNGLTLRLTTGRRDTDPGGGDESTDDGPDTDRWVLRGPVAAGADAVPDADGTPDLTPADTVPGSGSSEPPAELGAAIRGWVRDARLTSLATVDTTRTLHRLLDDRGSVLVTVVDDEISSTATLDSVAVLTSWRRWSVHPAAGAGKVVGAVEAMLDRHGKRTPDVDPLVRALGDRYPAAAEAPVPSRRGQATLVVQAHLTAQVQALADQDPRVRLDAPDSVHQMRVATRRLRSALSTFGPLLDVTVTGPLRAELAWLAGVLGAARDAEVQREHLAALLDAEPVELVIGPVRAEVDRHYATAYREAHTAVLATLDGPRYFRLRDGLDALAAAAPFTDEAQGPADRVATARVGAAFRKLKLAVTAVLDAQSLDAPAVTPTGATDTAHSTDELFHDARKAAKRLRYAAQALAPAFGRPAVTLAEAAENLQEILGEHQDSVVTRASLRELAVRSFLDGGNPFTLGRLHAFEQARAERAEAAFGPAWKNLDHKKLRRWLS